MFDLYKWCVFLIGTNKLSVESAAENKTKQRLKIAKIILLIVQGGMITVSIIFITKIMSSDLETFN
jgi:hypothetical protein